MKILMLSSSIESISLKPDIIHIHHAFTPLTFRAIKKARREKIPIVVTNHSIAPLHNTYFWKLLKLGVDTEKFKPMKKERDNKTLLYVGRFSARKGVWLLIPIFSRCLRNLTSS